MNDEGRKEGRLLLSLENGKDKNEVNKSKNIHIHMHIHMV